MANDNVTANSGSGGATFRTLSDGTNEWVAEVAAYVTGGSANSWTLAPVDLTHGLPVQPMTSSTWAATQSGTWNITNISGTISLPTGAATSAKQPALGTAGTASSDVLTVQGIASMTALKVDGSATTQPVSWSGQTVSITANSSVNVAQVGGSAVATAATGTQKVGITGNAGAAMDAAGQNASSPANSLLVGAQFNTSPTTISSGNMSPLQVDNAGNLLVNVKAGGASGGTSSSFGSAVPSTGTASGYSDGTNMQLAKVFDSDTGAGTDYVVGVNLRQSASGGSIEIGTSTHPVQVSLANTAANSTAVKVDGSAVTQPVSWTSQTVSITANSAVNVAQMNGVATTMGNGVSGTGVQRVTIASDSTGQISLASGSNTIGALTANQSVNIAQMNGVTTTMGNGTSGTGVQRVTIASDSTGQVALAAGSNTVGAVNLKPVTSGGLSFKKVLSASGTNLTSVKASAGQIYGIYLACTNASARYLHLYNVASGSVTVGTTAPDITFAIPGNASGAGFVLTTEQGIAFGTAITYALTTGSADTDTGSVASGEITGAILYA